MITATVFFEGIFYISLILAIFSVPNIVSTILISNRQMTRYRMLRSLTERDRHSLPPNVLGEWLAVQSAVGYGSMIMMEVDRLNQMRPSIIQAELSVALIITLYFVPGFSEDLFFWAGLIVFITLWAVAAGELTVRRYAQEYLSMAMEVEKEDREDLDIIYS